MVHNIGENPGAGYRRLANARVLAFLVEKDTVELQARADGRFPVIDLHDIAFAHAILARSILKNSVHRRLSDSLSLNLY
jgi:hypothetical protein